MMRKTTDDITPILDEVKKCLVGIYGPKLKGIVLYGSHARGDATDGSDIDLIILLGDMDDPIAEMERFSEKIWQLDLKYDTVISIIPFAKYQYETRKLPVILNAKREGIVL